MVLGTKRRVGGEGLVEAVSGFFLDTYYGVDEFR